MKLLIEKIVKFNKKRSWDKFHDPRSLVLALCGEIGELAQLFCWRRRSANKISASYRKLIEGEIADILIYLFALCSKLNIDPGTAILNKLEENEKRFPIKRNRGRK
jgi:dCTP diphosphatase